MTPLSWFGSPWTWALLLLAWLGLGVAVGLMIGALAHIEDLIAERRRRR